MALKNLLKPSAAKAPGLSSRTSPGTVPASKKRIHPVPRKPSNYKTIHPVTRTQTTVPMPPVPGSQGPAAPAAPPAIPAVSGPKSYGDWVKYHQGIGTQLPTGTALRDRYWAYRAAHGSPVPGSPQASADAKPNPDLPLSFNPDALDAQGHNDLAALREQLLLQTGQQATWNPATKQWEKAQVGNGELQNNLNRTLRELAMMEAQNRLNAEQGNLGVDSNAASRGLFNSGIRDLGRAKVMGQLTQALSGLDASRGDATTNFDLALKRAIQAFVMGSNAANINSGRRRWPTFLKNSIGG